MTVRVYRSTDPNAPSLNGLVGSLINVLDACLVNGYGSLATTSLTQSGGIATVTTSVAHGLTGTPKVLISGVTPAAYNGEYTITVTGASTFTYAVAGSPATASVQGTVGKASSGWTKPYTGTNLAAYKQPAGSNGFYLMVDDNTTATSARMTGYETMSAVNTGTNLFPTAVQQSGGGYLVKSNAASSASRDWTLICNGKLFYLFVNQAAQAQWTTAVAFAFGDITTYKSGDAYHTIIITQDTVTSSSSNLLRLSTNANTITAGHWMARTFAQTGTSVTCSKYTDAARSFASADMGLSGVTYPNGADGAIILAPCGIGETVSHRGILPGLWNICHPDPLSHGDFYIPATGDLVGKTFEYFHNNTAGHACMVETSDTW